MRYIPHTPEDERTMLEAIGAGSVEELFAPVPTDMLLGRKLDIPEALAEHELRRLLAEKAEGNLDATRIDSFVGGGLYNHYVPAAVPALTSRSEFYTAYTPYQPEVSQGTLQSIFEYQTMMARLLGMEVSNASLYDGSTATSEAVLMALRIFRGKRTKVVFAGATHPEYVQVCRPVLEDPNSTLTCADFDAKGTVDLGALRAALNQDVAAVVVQYPNFFGLIEPLADIAPLVHEAGALLVVSFSEALAFGMLKPPGAFGADIVVGEGQSLGMPLSFGGPLLGIMTARKEYVRAMPGRLVGKTVDRNGNDCFVVTLSTREQHIRREKATSNICTNEGLCALTAAIYMSLLGNEGLARLARLNHLTARYLEEKLKAIAGVGLRYGQTPYFNEFVIDLPRPSAEVVQRLANMGVAAGISLERYLPGFENALLVAATEMNSRGQIDRFAEKLASVLA